VWAGPDPEGPLMVQARALLAGPEVAAIAGDVIDRAAGSQFALEIPAAAPFDQPEHAVFTWDVALDADDLIGLMGTLSWVITMAEERREALIAETRRLLRDALGIEGDVTVDVAFRADAWRTRRHG